MIAKVSSENMMLLAVSLLLLGSSAVGDHRIRCGLNDDIGTRIEETEGGIEGRYTVEWCSQVPDAATYWDLKLEYPVNNNSKLCLKDNTTDPRRPSTSVTRVHSSLTIDIRDKSECNITCLSVPLDLLFSSCYKIVHKLWNPTRTFTPESAFQRVTNKFYSIEAFSKLRPIYTIEKDTNFLVVTFNLRYIPVVKFDMMRKEYEQATKNEFDVVDWVDANDNCTHGTYSVVCRLRYPSANRCVALGMEYDAPWRFSIKDPNVMHYCPPLEKEVKLDPGMDSRVWWAVAALALTLTVLAACWVAHSRILAGVRKKVLRKWINRYDEYTAEHSPAPPSDPGHILLLYARDCAPAMEAVGVLKEMLEAGAPGRVYDIFSPECMAKYAEAPEEWLCGLMTRPDVRVVLVQTPAAAALYEAQVGQDSLQMQQPLLGARVQYKKPHYGDVLLQFALSLVRGMAPQQQEYARYYIATMSVSSFEELLWKLSPRLKRQHVFRKPVGPLEMLGLTISVSELDAELMPHVAAYRRYVLPPHAARLLLDLRLPTEQPQRLRRLAAAVDSLLDYVRANENYLRDELMFL